MTYPDIARKPRPSGRGGSQELVELTTLEAFQAEGAQLRHALGHFFNFFQNEGIQVYSLREDGQSVLTLSAVPDSPVRHVVGLANRQPTPKELAVLETLLQPLGKALAYDPRTPY